MTDARPPPTSGCEICRRGEFAHHRVSNAIRIPEHALAEYLTGASYASTSPIGARPEPGPG